MMFTQSGFTLGTVSLFTREWIEISRNRCVLSVKCVSLFTREWIEILQRLKSMKTPRPVSLFTREWIEIAKKAEKSLDDASLPLYEGVD